MDRQEELQAIDEHLSDQGAYKCSMGEMFYTEEPSLRERMSFQIKSLKKPRTLKSCDVCGGGMNLLPSESSRIYCSRECSGIGAGKKKDRRVEVPCGTCGKLYLRRRSEMSRKNQYCSRTCSNKANSGKNGAGRKTVWDGIEYSSMAAAARAAGVSKHQLKGMLK